MKVETLPLLAATRPNNALRIASAVAWSDGTIDVHVGRTIADAFAELTPDQIHELASTYGNPQNV
jgi:hypothetical protein